MSSPSKGPDRAAIMAQNSKNARHPTMRVADEMALVMLATDAEQHDVTLDGWRARALGDTTVADAVDAVEPTTMLAVRIPLTLARAATEVANQRGMKRGPYIRSLIRADVAAALGVPEDTFIHRARGGFQAG